MWQVVLLLPLCLLNNISVFASTFAVKNGTKFIVPDFVDNSSHSLQDIFSDNQDIIYPDPIGRDDVVFHCICDQKEEHQHVCTEDGYCETAQSCYSYLNTDYPESKIIKGCLSSSELVRFTCSVEGKIAIVCCTSHLCNENLHPTLTPPVEEPSTGNSTTLIAIILSLFFTFFFVSAIVIYFVRRFHQKRMQEIEDQREAGRLEGGLRTTNIGDSTLADWMNSATSGSGSGLPFLVQRTMARQIQLLTCVGKGRYGEVWKGKWQGELVAVKVFASRDEQSWARETEIYNTVLLRHSNILGYIASDMTSRNSETQMWLVSYYHPNGSLFEFLQRRELDKNLMLKLCLTAANGIAHLHTDILGTCGKNAIAHRDIKSKNILVKDDLSCCIADLGLAVTHSPTEDKIVIPKHNHRVGTKRYMPPEVLEETLNTYSFECFKQADVYSFALVLWEIARRCVCGGIVEEAKPPFYDVVNYDPSFEEMRKVVAVDGYRPVIPNRWSSDPSLSLVVKIMKESWCEHPHSRLTIHRVKKTLMKAMDQLAPDVKAFQSVPATSDVDPLLALAPKADDKSYANNLL
uniref:receptor protein serine/threonine kinase n=1 Tax=Phallusia mammillata TaxID=59560 RepID=A0A6F9DU10_9ASCI|nr:Tgfbr-Ia [Phallusia mammillata]